MNFVGSSIEEFRLFDNPADPSTSSYTVKFWLTVLEAVIDPRTGRNLAEIIGTDDGALFSHIADTGIHVTPEWVNSINEIIAELVAFSQQDFLSAEDRAKWNQAALDAAAALLLSQQSAGLIVDMQGQIAQLQESINNNITANPFMVTFSNLNGIVLARGIWDAANHRIEC